MQGGEGVKSEIRPSAENEWIGSLMHVCEIALNGGRSRRLFGAVCAARDGTEKRDPERRAEKEVDVQHVMGRLDVVASCFNFLPSWTLPKVET